MIFDDLSLMRQRDALLAALKFLNQNGYTSIYAFGRARGIGEQRAWEEILDQAGLPVCAMPDELRVL